MTLYLVLDANQMYATNISIRILKTELRAKYRFKELRQYFSPL